MVTTSNPETRKWTGQEEVDSLATHGLSYHRSEGHYHRYGAINDIMHRALTIRLEPSGLPRSDGKCPDVVTVVTRSDSKLLVWDATCPDTTANCYTPAESSREAGAVAAQAEESEVFLSFFKSHVHPSVSGNSWCFWHPNPTLS